MADAIYHRWLDFLHNQRNARQSPHGYLKWPTYLAEWTTQATALIKNAPNLSERGIIKQHLEEGLSALCKTKVPPRYVSNELATAWRNTKTPVLTWNHPFVLPGYVLFLPIPAGNDRALDGTLEWGARSDPRLVSLMVLHADFGLTVYYCVGWYEDETDMIQLATGRQSIAPDEDYDKKGVDALVRDVASVAINSWLVHAYEPELIEEVAIQSSSRGFGRKAGKPSPIAPTWIGRNFKIRRESAPAADQEAGIKVRPHWRSGHWHTVRHGKGKEHTRTQWYRPTYVNADQAA